MNPTKTEIEITGKTIKAEIANARKDYARAWGLVVSSVRVTSWSIRYRPDRVSVRLVVNLTSMALGPDTQHVAL
jgi:hypothetical protein